MDLKAAAMCYMYNIFAVLVVLLVFVTEKVVISKTIDEIMFEASSLTSQFDHILDQSGSIVKVEMDMLFKSEDWKEIMERNATDHCKGRKKRNAERDVTKRWTDNTIPYRLAPYVFTYQQKQVLKQARDDWSRYTCIKFREAVSTDRNYIRFQNAQGCWSYVGMVTGEQEVGLAPGCRVKGVVIHELGHAIGMQHEQTRPDRDNYVSIIHANIPENVRYNFERFTWSVINSYGVPYDYRSIMHYGGKAFTTNGGLTIKTKDPAYQNVIGNREGLSFHDIKLANRMYSCSEKNNCPKKDCPGSGFVGKDCKCWCPGNPYRECQENERTTPRPVVTTKSPVTEAPTECKDQHSSCSSLVSHGGCNNEYKSIMASYCRQACGFCEEVAPKCTDDNRYCNYWARQNFCFHVQYRTYMKSTCKLSCDLCDARTGRVMSDDSYVDPCDDSGSNLIHRHSNILIIVLFSLCWITRRSL